MARLFLLGLAIIAAGCTAGSATAPVSAAAIGAFELINLRELPIPRNVTSIYFEQPILGYAQAERTSCFFDRIGRFARAPIQGIDPYTARDRSEEHTSELQSLRHLVCRLLLEKKKKNKNIVTEL